MENFVYVQLDGERFRVHSEFENKIKSAELMNELNDRMIKLMKYLISIGEENDPRVNRLLKRYNYQNMTENSPNNLDGSTSYMENKGQIFALCLRSAITPHNYHSMHTLTFVTMHELAHLMTKEYGHTPEFWSNFAYLLKHGKDSGIHIPVDYSKAPIEYCGIQIRDNPYFS